MKMQIRAFLTEHTKYWAERIQIHYLAVTPSFTITEIDFVIHHFLDIKLSAAENSSRHEHV